MLQHWMDSTRITRTTEGIRRSGRGSLAEVKNLVSGDALKTEANKRSKPYDETTVHGTSESSIAKKVLGFEEEGWEVLRNGKTSTRLKKTKGTDQQLEDDVWSMLYNMGYKVMNSGRKFGIQAANSTDPRQIDIYAKDDETVLIVECTHSRDVGPKSLKVLLDKIHALQQDIVRFVHDAHGKDPKLKIKFATATKNVEWRAADRDRAREAGIAVITEVDLAYYKKLTTLLREAARFQFLGRYLNNQRVEGLKDVVHATRGHAGGKPFYTFLISPWELMKLSYVHHKSKTSDENIDSYQRMVKPSRLKRIGEYLDNGGKFPTNIVINFKSSGPLRFDKSGDVGEMQVGSLTLPGQYGSAWVIDGQHRLFGYAHSDLDPSSDRSVVSVLAYENLPVRDEIRLFVDINTEQVKVSRNLVGEILSGLDIEDDDAQRRLDALHARIGLRLDEERSSPLRGRIITVSSDKSAERCITLTSITQQLLDSGLVGKAQRNKGGHSTLTPGPLGDTSNSSGVILKKAVSTLSLYLGLFADGLKEHWQYGNKKGGYLCTNSGARSLLQLLQEIADHIRTKTGIHLVNLDPEGITEKVLPYVAPIIEFFAHATPEQVQEFRARGSLQGVAYNCLQMQSIIFDVMPEFMNDRLQAHRNSRDVDGTKQARELIEEIANTLYEDVTSTLKKHHGEGEAAWWMKGVPASVRAACDKVHNKTNTGLDRWQHLELDHYADIIVSGDNWTLFKDHYGFYEKGRKAEQVRWITLLAKAGEVTNHPQKGPLSKDQVEDVRRVHAAVKRHIEQRHKVDPKSPPLGASGPSAEEHGMAQVA